MDTNQALYPIREVSRITGVNSITLRAWERRYGLIEPVRTESGHRLYTEAHIQQVQQAVVLTQQGIPISRVKSVIEQTASSMPDMAANLSQSSVAQDSTYDFLLHPLFALNSAAFEQALDQMFVDLPEQQAYAQLLQLSLQQSAWSKPQKTLWQNVVSLRLQVRLRYQLQALPKHHAAKTLVIETSRSLFDSPCAVTQLLLRIAYAQQGIYSWMVEMSPADAMAELLPLMKALDAKTIALVGLKSFTQQSLWCDWSQRYPSVEMQIWWHEDEPKALAAYVQNQSFLIESLFTGR